MRVVERSAHTRERALLPLISFGTTIMNNLILPQIALVSILPLFVSFKFLNINSAGKKLPRNTLHLAKKKKSKMETLSKKRAQMESSITSRAL